VTYTFLKLKSECARRSAGDNGEGESPLIERSGEREVKV
jgi:hypothetical protein